MGSMDANPFAILVGEQLSSVEFVQDYVQLRFDGPCLTAFTPPTVCVGRREWRWGEAGYRDALCERIATLVREASVQEAKAIRIVFDDGAVVEVSLRPEDFRGLEAAMFTTSDAECWVWQEPAAPAL